MEKKPQNKWLLITSGFSILLILGAATLLLVSKFKGSPAPQWTIYTSTDGKFKAFFCGEPKPSDITLKTSSGEDITQHAVFSDGGNGVGMGVMWTDYPASAFTSTKRADVIDMLAMAAAKAGGRLIDHEKSVKNGLEYSEVAFTSSVDGSYNRQLVTAKGVRVYTVQAHSLQDDSTHHDVMQFINSFTTIE